MNHECSAGVGRTGTFIVLDTLMQRLAKGESEVNVFETVLNLWHKRTRIVQAEEQYVYIHDCLVDAIKELNTPASTLGLY